MRADRGAGAVRALVAIYLVSLVRLSRGRRESG